MKLYELTSNYAKVLEMIEEGAEGLEDTLESIQDAIEEKAVNLAKIIRTIDEECEAIKAEEERLSNRRKALEKRRDSIKTYLENQLISVGTEKVKTPLFTIYIQSNQPSVDVIDDKLIPKTFFIEQEPKLDKNSLLQALKEGKDVPGVQLKQTRSLRIR